MGEKILRIIHENRNKMEHQNKQKNLKLELIRKATLGNLLIYHQDISLMTHWIVLDIDALIALSWSKTFLHEQ